MPPRGKYQIKLNSVMFSMMLEELMAGPSKAQDIVEYTGMSIITVQRTLRVMHRRKVIHIAAWEKDARGAWTMRAFALGNKKDAPKPKPGGNRTHSQRQRRAAAAAMNGAFSQLQAANDGERRVA